MVNWQHRGETDAELSELHESRATSELELDLWHLVLLALALIRVVGVDRVEDRFGDVAQGGFELGCLFSACQQAEQTTRRTKGMNSVGSVRQRAASSSS